MVDSEKLIQVPKWILEAAMDALRMAYNSNKGSNCEKRNVAQAYNFLKAYYEENVDEENIDRIIRNYTSEKLD